MATPLRHDYRFLGLLVLLIAATAAGGYYGYTQYQDIQNLQQTLLIERQTSQRELELAAARLDAASSTITQLSTSLAQAEDDYRNEKRRNDELEDEVRDTINTVMDLDKLSKTDKELLQKYSKVYFLNENYIPSKLKQIPKDYILAGRSEQYFHTNALPYLEKMIDDAAEDGVDLKVISAYRSFDTQAQLKDGYNVTYGSGANAFSADQGYSEHQLGTTLDLSDTETAGPYLTFQHTTAYEWLTKNAYKYGFILSYPNNNTFYIFEPWHWRFVGKELARDLHRDDANFYDWDQRKIDSYLIKIFD